MEHEQRLHQLTVRRTTLMASLDRAEQFLESSDDNRDRIMLQVRLENLDTIWRELESVQAGLECEVTSEEGMNQNACHRTSYENKYFRIKAGLLSKLSPFLPNENIPQTPHAMVSSSLKGLKLPTVALPEFDGDFKQWLAFHDTVLALIHSNSDVPDIQKFHYLRAAVKGEAGQLIESIGISAVNYPLAWQALVNRYANEYLLKKRHLQAMLEVPRVKKETSASLHGTVDDFERHSKILRQIGEPVDSWSTILEHLLCIRLPDESLKAWEDYASTIEEPTYNALVEFLQRRIRVLDSISVNHTHSPTSYVTTTNVSTARRSSNPRPSTRSAVDTSTRCYACEQRHPLFKCFKFERLPLTERINLVTLKRLCMNCFRSDHFARNCPSKYSCKTCKKRHHSLLHPGYVDNDGHSHYESTAPASAQATRVSSNVSVTPPDEGPSSAVFTVATSTESIMNEYPNQPQKNVFMLTAVVKITDRYGKEHLARALLDSASQPNLMTERMAQILRLKRKRTNILVQGIGKHSQQSRESISTIIRSRREKFEVNAEFLILHKIVAELPVYNVSTRDWKLPRDVFLADPEFNKTGEIDLLMGIEHFFSFFNTTRRIHLGKHLPTLIDSVFGWLVSGKFSPVHPSGQKSRCSITAISLVTLEESIERFWKMEELSDRINYSQEEKQCEQFYSSTVSRQTDGRYMEESTTTKLRVVFDASAKTSTGFSLNEALLVGPVIQDDLLTIILRFRTYPVAVVADIAKMYRQILLHHDDTTLQRIVWRFKPTDPVECYELQTVTYGLSPSSFLATRTLEQLAVDEGESHPIGALALRKSFYMDDFIGGAQSVAEAIELRNELTDLLAKGGFSLRKWASNKLDVLEGLSADKIGTQSAIKFNEHETIKALGISREPESDFFRFDSKIQHRKGSPTKRSILSDICQLFDPLGLLSPVIIRGKMLMQQLWLLPCSWDDNVPDTIEAEWRAYIEQLPILCNCTHSRTLPKELMVRVLTPDNKTKVGIFVFN
ncbi:uncharacterized protein LOC129767178 [Toxorhynchites rutilus septentrionalis]|uniref:uncharacterized protein LOC129767178 n=1 Tax=Toxorhynchites rutilus septentrionalis TaxID=329112 RepID=UPI002478B5AF|nr:uncharacterized protein LOC129767178 [Toxorhynchites rutilus septentrionalis]